MIYTYIYIYVCIQYIYIYVCNICWHFQFCCLDLMIPLAISGKEPCLRLRKIMDFLFDDITDLQKAEMMKAARVEDLHRAGDDDEHTNDEDEMNEARVSLHLMSADLYAPYVKAREVLGYV